MRDTIEEEDLYVDVSKTQLENEIHKKGSEITLLQEQLVEEGKKSRERDEKLISQENRLNQMMKMIDAIQLEKKMKNNQAFSTYVEM